MKNKRGRPPVKIKTERFSLSVISELLTFLQSHRKEIKTLLTAYKTFKENADREEVFRFKFVGDIQPTKIKEFK